ncbi:MAG: hypothetical protein ACRD1K_05635 [Acidimicrobiales bacterium]
MAAKTKRMKSAMTDEHKQALALGREQGRAVRRYLEALEAHRPKRGRKRTPESIQRRLDDIETRLETADPLSRLQLRQERMNLENELATKSETVDISALEDDFVEAAQEYGSRKGITYMAWREAGIDAAVLKRAGIRRGGVIGLD